jgi:hypothetical protein
MQHGPAINKYVYSQDLNAFPHLILSSPQATQAYSRYNTLPYCSRFASYGAMS